MEKELIQIPSIFGLKVGDRVQMEFSIITMYRVDREEFMKVDYFVTEVLTNYVMLSSVDHPELSHRLMTFGEYRGSEYFCGKYVKIKNYDTDR